MKSILDSTHRDSPSSRRPIRVIRLAAPNALLLLLLALCGLLPANAEAGTYWDGQSVVNVSVALEGPRERLIVQSGDASPTTYTYTATPHYDVTGEKEEEAEEHDIDETYAWSVGCAIVVSGGEASDDFVEVKYSPEDESGNTISVTYTATPGGTDTDSVYVVVPRWETNDPITCSGGIISPSNDDVFATGQEVTLTLDTITDTDRRIGAVTTEPSDSCTVTWTASAGAFKDEDNTGASVVWVAPDDPTENITISASIEDQAAIPVGEAGTRDDSPHTVDSITIDVIRVKIGLTNAYSPETPTYSPEESTYKIDTGTAEFIAIIEPSSFTATNYEWTFGDDDTSNSTGNTTQHVYPYIDIYSATVTVTVNGCAVDSEPISVDLDYSPVYPVTFESGENLDFAGHSQWVDDRISRLVPATGVNALEKDILENSTEFLSIDLNSYDLAFSEGWDPSFYSAGFDCTVFSGAPMYDSGTSPIVTSISILSQSAVPLMTASSEPTGLKATIQKLSALLEKQKDALMQVAGVQWYNDFREKCDALRDALGTLDWAYSRFTSNLTYNNFQVFVYNIENVAKKAGELVDHMKSLTKEINSKGKKYHLPESTKTIAVAVEAASKALSEFQKIISDAKALIDPLGACGQDIEAAFHRFESEICTHYQQYFSGLLPSTNPPQWILDVSGVDINKSFMDQSSQVRRDLVIAGMVNSSVPTSILGASEVAYRETKNAATFVAGSGFAGLTLWEKLFNPSAKLAKAVETIKKLKATVDLIKSLRKQMQE
jgi:hypothetical protein